MKIVKIIFLILFISFFNDELIHGYLIKKKPKIPEPNEFNIPQNPDISTDLYPGIERFMLDQKYNEMMPGEDLVQIETAVGKALPMNGKLIATITPQLTAK